MPGTTMTVEQVLATLEKTGVELPLAVVEMVACYKRAAMIIDNVDDPVQKYFAIEVKDIAAGVILDQVAMIGHPALPNVVSKVVSDYEAREDNDGDD